MVLVRSGALRLPYDFARQPASRGRALEYYLKALGGRGFLASRAHIEGQALVGRIFSVVD